MSTWVVLLAIVGWFVAAFVAGTAFGWWTTAVAVALAVGLPPLIYPWSKGFTAHLLYRMDPPDAQP